MLFQYPADVYARGAVAFVGAVLLYAITARFTKIAPARG
jgi:hypothetical protein